MVKRLLSAALCLLLLLGGCQNAVAPTTLTAEQKLLGVARGLLPQALEVLFLYEGELPVNKQAAPYYAPDGREYYPTTGYTSLAELHTHARTVFTEDFCQAVLDPKTENTQATRFIERQGVLWQTKSVRSMGWIDSLVVNTIEVVSLEDGRCVVSCYSQSMLDAVTRREFLLLQEQEGWRLDSYYHMNNTAEVVYGPTVWDFLQGLNGGDKTTHRIAILPPGDRVAIQLKEDMLDVFVTMLAALEYDPASVRAAAAVPDGLEQNARMELRMQGGDCLLSASVSGLVYLTAPDGAVTELQLAYPGGMNMLIDLMSAAKWRLKEF